MGVVDHQANQVTVVDDVANGAFVKGVLFDTKGVRRETFVSTLLGLVAWNAVVVKVRVFLAHESVQGLVPIGDTSDDGKGRALFYENVLAIEGSMDGDAHRRLLELLVGREVGKPRTQDKIFLKRFVGRDVDAF